MGGSSTFARIVLVVHYEEKDAVVPFVDFIDVFRESLPFGQELKLTGVLRIAIRKEENARRFKCPRTAPVTETIRVVLDSELVQTGKGLGDRVGKIGRRLDISIHSKILDLILK
jgi:hypothetical protein